MFLNLYLMKGMSPLNQSTNQRRQPPSIPTTSEVRPLLIIQKRRPFKPGKPPIPQPRIIIKQQENLETIVISRSNQQMKL